MSEWTNLKNDWYSEGMLGEYCRLCKEVNVFLFCAKNDLLNILKFADKHKLNWYLLAICKKSPIPLTNNTWMPAEYAVHMTERKIVASKRYDDKIPYFIVGQSKKTEHPNEKDLAMCYRIVRNITKEGNSVFDPFAGSGSIGVACVRQGREYTGCELKPEYAALAEKRISELTLL